MIDILKQDNGKHRSKAFKRVCDGVQQGKGKKQYLEVSR